VTRTASGLPAMRKDWIDYTMLKDRMLHTMRETVLVSPLIAPRVGQIQQRTVASKRMAQFYRRYIQSGDLCFDIGANLGHRTAIFAALGANVVAVEPQDACVRRLRARFAHMQSVSVVATAVGDHAGSAELAVSPGASTLATLSDRWRSEGRFAATHSWTQTEHVCLTTLDALIQRYGKPAFCKIDVEGFEPAVVRGLSQPIRMLSYEFTRELFDDARACIAHLSSIGEVYFNGSIGESMELIFPSWVTADELFHGIASIPEADLWGDIYVMFPDFSA